MRASSPSPRAATPPCSRASRQTTRACCSHSNGGIPLEPADGLPRLVGPSDWDCFKSVKAVDRIEVTREPGEATAAAIALGRPGR
ncbi:MAG: hypothetical protein ACRDM1_02580 [Gaiellaceae bacterium]